MAFIEPCLGIGHNLSLICQMTSEDIKHQLIIITSLKAGKCDKLDKSKWDQVLKDMDDAAQTVTE